MEMAMMAAHLSNSPLNDVCGWSLRQVMGVVKRGESVLPFLNPYATGKASEPTPTTADQAAAVASLFKLPSQ